MSSGGPALRRLALLLASALAGCAAPQEEGLLPGPAAGVTTSLNAHVPPFARWPYQPFSREAAVQIALREWRAFGQQVVFPNVELPVDEERQEGMWQRVGEYWWLGLDPRWKEQAWTGIHNENGEVFPESQDGNYAWSAAFISYVMRMAGAGNGFPYSENHAYYINAARRHEMGEEPGIVLTTERMEVYAPQRGDLICYWRGRRAITYDDLLDVIGGNVDNAVAMKHIPATVDDHLAGPDGVVLDPDHNYFVVLKVDYAR